MKWQQLVRQLEKNCSAFLLEGKKHTIYYSPSNRKTSTVPRHVEIIDVLARKICKDLDIPPPK
jgi:mRNA interferase HicA